MAGFTSIVLATAAVAGVATSVMSANKQRKSDKENARRLREQRERAIKQQKEAARERAELAANRDDTGAQVKLGTDDAGKSGKTKVSQVKGSSRQGSVGSSIGGVSPSSKLGL